MYKSHEDFVTPREGQIIWRYMDFIKYVALLDRQGMTFSSAALLSLNDPYEGSYAKGNFKYDLEKDLAFKSETKEVRENFKRELEKNRLFIKERIRNGVYVNSWYANNQDSAAMWKCYADSEDGVAIQTTLGRLKGAFALADQDIYIGKIAYMDYEKGAIPERKMFLPFLYKRKSFQYERELRAVLVHKDLFDLKVDLPEVVTVPVDLERLIGQVFVSPTAPDWIRDLVVDVTARFGLKKKVVRSDLKSPGLW